MDFNNFLINLAVCFLLSFLLGLERQIRRRFIGLRTMILVALGSFFFCSYSFLITGYSHDASRIAAQVVAGIGFLGAGVIIKDDTRNRVTGLTTAATLWCDSSIGILCAGGFIKEAIVAASSVLFANIVLRYINSFINNKVEERRISEVYRFEFNLEDTSEFTNYFHTYVEKNSYITIKSYKVNNNKVIIEATVFKTNLDKVSKFVEKIVTDMDIKSFKYENINELKMDEENEEI